MSLQSLRSVLLIVGAVAVLISCSKSPEDARKELVQLGIPYESSAFIESAGRGDLAAVKLFIRANMDPNVDHGEALVEAVRRNRREVIDYLLDNGANADSKGRSLLTSTGMKDVDNVDLITHLLDKGANINYQSVTKPTWDPLGEGERIYVVIAPLSNALEEKM